MKNATLRLLIFALMGLSACAPKVQERAAPEIKTDFGPVNKDTELDFSNLNNITKPSQNIWQKPTQISALKRLEFAESIYSLSSLYDLPALKEATVLGLRHFRTIHQNSVQSFESSPYVEAIVGSTEKEANDQISEAETNLPLDQVKVMKLLEQSESIYPWPQAPDKSGNSLIAIKNYLSWFLQELSSIGLNESVLKGLQEEISKQATSTFEKLEVGLAQVKAASSIVDVINQINQLLKAMEYSVPGETAGLLKQGAALGEAVLKIQDEQDILTVIVEIFKMLGPEDRKVIIGGESVALYDFLKDASADRLTCLQVRGCKRDLIVWAGKKLQIFPEIEKRGVASLRLRINSEIRAYILARVDEEIVRATRSVPRMLAEQIDGGIKDKLNELAAIKADYSAYVKNLAQRWSDLRIHTTGGRIRGLEQSLSSSNKNESGSELLGQGFVIKTRILNRESHRLNKEERVEWALEHVNKLLALGGYKKSDKESIRPLNQPLDYTNLEFKGSLQDILKSNFSFAVPDRFKLTAAYSSQPNLKQDMNVSVLGQARLLRGFSESINFIKDWEVTSFDQILGQETLGQTIENAPSSLADRKLFPKDTLIALSIGNAAIILKNLLKDLSPVFIVGQQSKIIWTNEFNIGEADAASVAGVVNLLAGERDLKVVANDVSEYILALSDFIQSIRGLEMTKSEYLLARAENGKTAIEELADAQRQIKLLVLGLANFLSSKMTSSDGFVHEVYSIRLKGLEDSPVQIMTQFRAIQSLIKAYELTKITPYLWSAIDLYYKLNASFFDPKGAFYRGVTGLADGTEVLVTLAQLQPYLPRRSQAQLERLSNSWLALAKARLQ